MRKADFTYRTFAIWGGGIDGIETETEFADHVQITTTVFKDPSTHQIFTERGRVGARLTRPRRSGENDAHQRRVFTTHRKPTDR